MRHLVHGMEGAADAEVVLELHHHVLAHQRLEERVEQHREPETASANAWLSTLAPTRNRPTNPGCLDRFSVPVRLDQPAKRFCAAPPCAPAAPATVVFACLGWSHGVNVRQLLRNYNFIFWRFSQASPSSDLKERI